MNKVYKDKVYKDILLNLMLIENEEEEPLVRLLACAKIVGIVEYAFVKDDIE